MKKTWVLTIFLSLFGIIGISQTRDKDYIQSFIKMDYNKFKYKSVKEFINFSKTTKDFNGFIFKTSKPGCLAGVILQYNDSVSIHINITTFSHIKRFSASQNWIFDEVINEKINDVQLYRAGKLIKGKKNNHVD